MNILVTSLGSNTSIGVIKALRLQNEVDIKIVGTDTNKPEFCAGYQFCDRFFTIDSTDDPANYKKQLIKIISEEQIECIIPIHDLEIELVSELSIEKPNLTFWAVNTPEIVSKCNHKINSHSFVKSLNIPVPNVYLDNNIQFPVILKPVKGVSSQNVVKVNDANELDFFSKKLSGIPLFVQDFIEGEEYTVDTYSDYSGRFYGGVVRKRISTKSGISVKGEIIENQELLILSNDILTFLGYKGAANIQFIVKNCTPYFIEINPRFSGAGILSYKAGFNSPLFTVLEAKGKKLPSIDKIEINKNLKMSRYWEESFYG